VAGGTKVFTAFQMVNEIVEKEHLARDYNIYVFYGTDGDDWEKDGKQTLVEIDKMLSYAARIGITVVRHTYAGTKSTEVENYINGSKVLDRHSHLIKMDVMGENVDDSRIIQGIKTLIS
jgi:uncharacterized sporulation protein YeaH/YhbH (DUF444 family)